MALLACARIGAPHSVVFGGFSADSLRDRINDAEAKVLITGDGAWRRGASCRSRRPPTTRWPSARRSRRCSSLRRTEHDVPMTDGRDVWWHDLVPGSRPSARPSHGRRGPALPALHERHHRQAQGDHAHHRRLPHAGGVDPQVRVRPASRHRRVLVRGRRRVGHRALLHRLRPAREPDHGVLYEGRPTSPTRTASGRSSRSTRSPSSTRRPPRSARS